MLCKRTCIIGRTCLAGVHVFRVEYLSGDVSYWNACSTGGQVLLEGMPYRRSCLTDIHVLQEYMFHRITYLT